MVQFYTIRFSYIATLWVSLVSFAAITLCVASQRVFIFVRVYFVMTQSGNFWIHRRISPVIATCAMSNPSRECLPTIRGCTVKLAGGMKWELRAPAPWGTLDQRPDADAHRQARPLKRTERIYFSKEAETGNDVIQVQKGESSVVSHCQLFTYLEKGS